MMPVHRPRAHAQGCGAAWLATWRLGRACRACRYGLAVPWPGGRPGITPTCRTAHYTGAWQSKGGIRRPWFDQWFSLRHVHYGMYQSMRAGSWETAANGVYWNWHTEPDVRHRARGVLHRCRSAPHHAQSSVLGILRPHLGACSGAVCPTWGRAAPGWSMGSPG